MPPKKQPKSDADKKEQKAKKAAKRKGSGEHENDMQRLRNPWAPARGGLEEGRPFESDSPPPI